MHALTLLDKRKHYLMSHNFVQSVTTNTACLFILLVLFCSNLNAQDSAVNKKGLKDLITLAKRYQPNGCDKYFKSVLKLPRKYCNEDSVYTLSKRYWPVAIQENCDFIWIKAKSKGLFPKKLVMCYGVKPIVKELLNYETMNL